MGVPRVWNDANNKDRVAQAQQEPSHSCVCCCPSIGPGMGPHAAARGSPLSTCIRRSAAPAAASPHNTLRCAFIPLAQPLERRWGKPSLSTLTPAAVSPASRSPFQPAGKGTCSPSALHPGECQTCLWCRWITKRFMVLTGWPALCTRVRCTQVGIASVLPFPGTIQILCVGS